MDNKLATKVNLARHGVVVDNLLCCFCGEKEETTSHLFLECKIIWLVWSNCYDWVWLKLTDHLEPISHFLHLNFFNAPTTVHLTFGNTWIALVSEI